MAKHVLVEIRVDMGRHGPTWLQIFDAQDAMILEEEHSKCGLKTAK
jgi:hypothetical protein